MLKLSAGKFLGKNRCSYQADGLIVSETEYRQRVFEGWHAHESNHLTLILRGGNREQRKHGEFTALPGQILFYRPGELHRNTETLHPSKNINLEIEDDFLKQYQARIFEESSLSFQINAKFTLLKIYREILNQEEGAASIHSLALALLASPLEESSGRKTPDWIIRLREILNDRWDEILPLAELSELLGIHPVTISKGVPKFLSSTLGEYSRKIKIERAVGLLSQSTVSLADITYRCGFADQSHFTRAFRRTTGFTPEVFRKICAG